jgi:hypothetical protein
MVEVSITQPDFLQDLEGEVLQEVIRRQGEFIRLLVEALMAPDPLDPARASHWPRSTSSGMGEFICRKHQHQGWCQKMHALRAYTMLAVSYHHARKRLRNEGGDKYMKLVCFYAEAKSSARVRFYGTDCDCPGLSQDISFEAFQTAST